jgi:hypothetical protein
MTAFIPRSWLAGCRWTPLSVWLAVLAGLASIAATRASLWPLWPRSEPLPEAVLARSLQQAGLGVTAVPLKEEQAKPQRDTDRALSQTLAFRFASGEELRLLRGVARNPLEFEPKTFTLKRKDLFMKDPKLAGPPPQRVGKIAGRPARQTCLVALSPRAMGYGVASSAGGGARTARARCSGEWATWRLAVELAASTWPGAASRCFRPGWPMGR